MCAYSGGVSPKSPYNSVSKPLQPGWWGGIQVYDTPQCIPDTGHLACLFFFVSTTRTGTDRRMIYVRALAYYYDGRSMHAYATHTNVSEFIPAYCEPSGAIAWRACLTQFAMNADGLRSTMSSSSFLNNLPMIELASMYPRGPACPRAINPLRDDRSQPCSTSASYQ